MKPMITETPQQKIIAARRVIPPSIGGSASASRSASTNAVVRAAKSGVISGKVTSGKVISGKVAWLLVLAFLALLAGCAARDPLPVKPVSGYIYGQHSQQQVKNAILLAGQNGWIMSASSEGIVDARYQQGEQMASVRISYTPHVYTISYLSSKNMASFNGQINQHYHQWIQHLNDAIQVNLYHSADGKDNKCADGKCADNHCTDGTCTDNHCTDSKNTDGNSTDSKSTDVKNTDVKSTDVKSTDVKSTNGKSADVKSTDSKSTNGNMHKRRIHR